MNKETVFRHLEDPEEGRPSAVWVRGALLVLIILNVIAVMLRSMETIGRNYAVAFRLFEYFSVSVFGVEYLLRVWAITAGEKYKGNWGRLRYAVSPLALIDLAAILPSVLSMGFVDLRFLRVARLFRLLRVLKIGRYSATLRRFSEVAVEIRSEMFLTFLAMLLLLVAGSGAIFFAEHDAQPLVFSSIPAAMWWTVTTLTTVGYGDAYPVTALGKLVASAVAVIGIGMFALPSGILGAAFLESIRKEKRSSEVCPHCKRKLCEEGATE